MKRHYTADDYLAMVETARRWIPDVTFSGDLIVGFPGETDEDFQRTLELIRKVRYDQTFNFKYSERPDTPAARLPDDVPLEVKKERLETLMALQDGIWAETAAACVGETWTAVIEGPARHGTGDWKARTPNNRKVLLRGDGGGIGDHVDVRVTGCTATTFDGERVQPAR
jgi:tRNA-2-methylthio-N6-dimethylallyladenosine synthase